MNESSSPNSAALVSALRDAPVNAAVVGDLKMRVHSRLSASFLGLTPAVEGSIPAASQASGLPAVRPSGLARAVTTHKAVIGATLVPVFALGVLTGVAADRWQQHRQLSQRARVTEPVSFVAALPTAPSVALQPIVTPEDLTRVELTKASANVASSSAPSDSASTLAAERSLLDQARQALARGEPGAGLAPIERHAARFPRGILTEEREALAVRVLAALGNASAAVTRAEGFHRRFPNSLFAPAVDNAIATISRRNSEVESKP